MISALPITPESGRPAGDRLRDGHQVGLDPVVLDREHPPGAAEAGLHLVDDHDDPVLVAEPADAGHEVPRRDDEPAFALHRLDHDRRDLLGGDLRDQRALERRERRARVRAAVVLRERNAVHLGGERPEPRLVRVRLRGHRHREERAAVEGALEDDDGGALRVRARELDRVLDRLRAGVEERRLRRAGERRDRDQALGERDVDLVRHDREVGVREARELLLRGLDELRVRVADVEAADAAGEVDERVAVDVGERRAAPLLDDDRDGDRERAGDHLVLALEDRLRAGPRNRRPELDRPCRGHGRNLPERP